ncbi:MAG: hypothetical protein F9K44_11705 [Hyphomicrobiaceae bacterium]|nr:MAG: hypothetical protein F9K44_11705 [Hyphomicrobiaceae bacterium]
MLQFLRRSPGKEFWGWFEEHKDWLREGPELARVRNAERASQALSERTGELLRSLQRFDKRLTPLYWIAADGVAELIVTAEGQTEAFDRVFDLISQAPQLEDWRFLALKPRQPLPETLAGESVRLDCEALHYALQADGNGRAALLFLTEQASDDNFIELQHLAMKLAEAILGEEDMALNVGQVAMVSHGRFAVASPSTRIRPIECLIQEFDERFRCFSSMN